MKKLFILMIIMISMSGLMGCTEGYKKISPAEGKEMIENDEVIVVDVREQSEYNEGHIGDAILLPLGQISSSAQSVLANKNATIIVYCRSGKRSADAANKLIKLGYKDIYDMGGILDWKSAGYEIIK